MILSRRLLVTGIVAVTLALAASPVPAAQVNCLLAGNGPPTWTRRPIGTPTPSAISTYHFLLNPGPQEICAITVSSGALLPMTKPSDNGQPRGPTPG